MASNVVEVEEPVPEGKPAIEYQELVLKCGQLKMSSEYARSLCGETTFVPDYASDDIPRESFMVNMHADFAASYAITADKLIRTANPEPDLIIEDEEWEVVPPRRPPRQSGATSSQAARQAEQQQDDRQPLSPRSQGNGKRPRLSPMPQPWPQIQYFIKSPRDFNWNSVWKLVTNEPKNLTRRQNGLRRQATHIDYTRKKLPFLCVFNEFDVAEDLDSALESVGKMILAEEAASAAGNEAPLHLNIPSDIQYVCIAMMRSTFFRNNGSIVFHKRLFYDYCNHQAIEVDKLA